MTVSLRDDTCQLFVNAEEEKHQRTSEFHSKNIRAGLMCPLSVYLVSLCHAHAQIWCM